MKIKSERQSAKSCLDKNDSQDSFLNSVLREKRDYIGERACEIVCVHSHKLTAERAGERIKKAVGVSVYQISQAFKEINVLSVQVKNERRAVSKGVKRACKIDAEHQYDGNEEAKREIRGAACIQLLLKILQKALGMKSAFALLGIK
jgi:hypothetical protein